MVGIIIEPQTRRTICLPGQQSIQLKKQRRPFINRVSADLEQLPGTSDAWNGFNYNQPGLVRVHCFPMLTTSLHELPTVILIVQGKKKESRVVVSRHAGTSTTGSRSRV